MGGFGQVVIGPPGSGKTTYCQGMCEFLSKTGRTVTVVNLDPANDVLPYPCTINILDLVSLESVMEELDLGPNGALVYAMEHLEQNIDWLLEKLNSMVDHYFLFDLPGQAELYTHHESVRNIVHLLADKHAFRLCAVHLVDSYYCSLPSTFVSAVLLSLNVMIQLELPHVNVLSKMDLIEKYGDLAFGLEFYTSVGSLEYLQSHLDAEPFGDRYSRLNKALCELIEHYSLVSFIPLQVEDKECMTALSRRIDKANGYVYGGLSKGNESIMEVAESHFGANRIADVEETYISEKSKPSSMESDLLSLDEWDL